MTIRRGDYPTNVRLTPAETGLPLETVFLGFQIRSLDAVRFLPKEPAKSAGMFWSGLRTLFAIALGFETLRAQCNPSGRPPASIQRARYLAASWGLSQDS